MKNILVPTDFSKYAANALKLAIDISKKNKAKVHVLHVVEYPVGGTVDPMGMFVPIPSNKDFIKLLLENGEKKMESFCESIDIKLRTSVELGTPYVTIVEAIKNKEIDLIIMGTKGARGLKEIFVGSNAERVVRSASCPVITLIEPANFKEINSIAFAIDINNTPGNVFEKLSELQTLFKAKLHLVHINTPNNFERDWQTRKLLNSIVEKHRLKETETHIYNDVYVEDGIFSFAQYVNAGLIAMSTHGRRGLSHLVSGSFAEDVINHAKKPVWTIHIC